MVRWLAQAPGEFCVFSSFFCVERSAAMPAPRPGHDKGYLSRDDIEKEACFAIGLLAIKQSHQQRIADAGALPGLVALLKRAPVLGVSHGSTAGGVARRAADAITNLAHENVTIKTKVRCAALAALLHAPLSPLCRRPG